MTHWAVTTAFSVANWNKESFHVWSRWTAASGTWIAHWRPDGTWLVGFSFELTDIKWHASSFNMSWASTNDWGINWSSAVWARLKWWLLGTDAFDSVLATITNVFVGNSLHDFSVSTWSFVGNWTVGIGRIADAFVSITTNTSVFIVSSDQQWFTATIRTSSFDSNWTGFWLTDTLFFVDSGATVTWSSFVDSISGDHFQTSWTSGWLVVNWAFRRIALASVLWATLAFASGQNRANSITNWSWWAKFRFVNANLVVLAAASVIVSINVNSDWEFFNKATEVSSAIFDNWSSAMFWVADTFELWAAVCFSGALLSVSTSA